MTYTNKKMLNIFNTFRMSVSESDVESVNSDESTQNDYENVPEDKRFKLKILDGFDVKVKTAFTLKRGRSLPYPVTIKGIAGEN